MPRFQGVPVETTKPRFGGAAVDEAPDVESGLSLSDLVTGKRPDFDRRTGTNTNPTAGMATLDRFLAGVGQEFNRAIQGAQQVIPSAINAQKQQALAIADSLGLKDVGARIERTFAPITRIVEKQRTAEAERRKTDRPLLDTGAGRAGQVTGVITELFGPGVLARGTSVAPILTPTTIRGAATQGAALGATDPVVNEAERGRNILIGGGAGAGGQAILRGGQALVRAGSGLIPSVGRRQQERAAARAIEGFAANPDAARIAAANASELVPGSRPTLAEATEDPGLIGLQRVIRNTPEGGAALAERAREQNLARVRAIQEGFGGADEASAQAIRDAAAQQGRVAARGLREVRNSDNPTGMVVEDVISLAPVQIGAEALIQRNANRPVVQSALQYVRDLSSRPIRSADEAWNLRKTINDLMEGKLAGDQAGASAARRELITLRGLLDREMTRAYPQWGQFLRDYRGAQRAANQVDVGQALLDTGRAVRGATNEPVLTPTAFSRAAGNLDRTVARATEFRRATAENILTPKQTQLIDSIRRDLERFSRSEGAGIAAPGSATLANAAGANRLQDAVGPVGAAMIEPVSGAALLGLNAIRQKFGNEVTSIVREAVLDPARAAEILSKLPPRQRNAVVMQAAPLIRQSLLQLTANTALTE